MKKPMTFRELREELNNFTDEELDTPIHVLDLEGTGRRAFRVARAGDQINPSVNAEAAATFDFTIDGDRFPNVFLVNEGIVE